MTLRPTLLWTAFACLFAVAPEVSAAPAPAPARATSRLVTRPQNALPDTAVIARVDDRKITVYQFRDSYFSSDAETRPGTDSLSRVDFLRTLTDKEVISLEAVAAKVPLTPHDRYSLASYEEQLLSLWYYQAQVEKPVVITQKDLEDLHALESWKLRLRYLLMRDSTTAATVYAQLKSGRITWQAAARKYSVGPDSLVNGDLGFLSLTDLHPQIGMKVFALKPLQVSEPIADPDGWRVWQCLDRTPSMLPSVHAVKRLLWSQLKEVRSAPLERAFFDRMRRLARPAYDTTNIAWLADQFYKANHQFGSQDSDLDLRSRAPVLARADTGRVLARAGDQVYSAARLVRAYKDIMPIRRRKITTYPELFEMLERMVLAPTITATARAEQFDRRPEVVAEMQKKREGLMVAHMYDDSVQSRLAFDPAENRRWYEQHKREFVSRLHVRYALLLRKTEAGADSLIRRLDRGESALKIWAADSAAGAKGGGVYDLLEGQAHRYYHVLMEDLKQGQSTKDYLGGDKVWAVFHVIRHDDPHPMAYEEVRDIVTTSVENEKSEKVLEAWLKRLRKRHRIVTHPERLMRIELTDPTGDLPISDAR